MGAAASYPLQLRGGNEHSQRTGIVHSSRYRQHQKRRVRELHDRRQTRRLSIKKRVSSQLFKCCKNTRHETTDRIYAVVSLPFLNFPRFETNAANYTRLEIEFNPHEFDDVAEIDIKDGRVEATLSAAKQAYADKGFEGEVIYDINWISEEDQAPQWRMLNGEPAYVCTYYAVRKSSEYEEGRGQTVMFYIRPTIESGEVRK